MLTVLEFKEKLGTTALKDKQLEELRDSLYNIINKIIDEFFVHKYET